MGKFRMRREKIVGCQWIGIWGQGTNDFLKRIVCKSHRKMVGTETQSPNFLGFARDYRGCEQCVPRWPEAAWGLSPQK